MFKKTLYVYLPYGDNSKFNLCHRLSNHSGNVEKFKNNIPLLMD